MTWNNRWKRAGIKRKSVVVSSDVKVFDITTPRGDRYSWPAKHIDEATFQSNVVDYAFQGDQDTEWWHANQTARSRKGWFDLAIFQPNRKVGILTELKVRDLDGTSKQPSKAQWRFIAAATACGYDVRSWLYPDDEREAFETLTGLSWSAVQL